MGGRAVLRQHGESAAQWQTCASVLQFRKATCVQVRLNADTLAADGAPAMAAVCAGSLALQAAGLPTQGGLTAGASVGLLTRGAGATQAQGCTATAAAAAESVQADLSAAGTAGDAAGWFDAGSGTDAQQELLLDTQVLLQVRALRDDIRC
jgi:hypothetical protein